MRGASRGVLEVERGRRPLCGFASRAPGGPGAPPGGITTACEELADAEIPSWGLPKARPEVRKTAVTRAPEGERASQARETED